MKPTTVKWLVTLFLLLPAVVVDVPGLDHVSYAAGWSDYLAKLKEDKDNVKSAAIYAKDGQKLASDLQAKDGEVVALVAGLSSNSKFQEKGIVLAGVKYMFLTGDAANGSAVGRKGPTTIMLQTTKTTVLVVLSQDGANPGNISTIGDVSKLLISFGL